MLSSAHGRKDPQLITVGQLVRSPLGWFSLLRAAATTLALALGILLFEAHPIWAALTATSRRW